VNVVDSSGWLEYFAAGPNARFFAPPLQASPELLVPTITLYEVFKRVFEQRGEDSAFQAVALMQQGGTVLDLTSALALAAAGISLDLKIPMADSIILATARRNSATLWSQDADFHNVPGVKYVARQKAR
jgi:predicted nucleic acid-binding protein